MRVAVWYNNRDLRIEERPIPQIGPGELLLRVEASGLAHVLGLQAFPSRSAQVFQGWPMSKGL